MQITCPDVYCCLFWYLHNYKSTNSVVHVVCLCKNIREHSTGQCFRGKEIIIFEFPDGCSSSDACAIDQVLLMSGILSDKRNLLPTISDLCEVEVSIGSYS